MCIRWPQNIHSVGVISDLLLLTADPAKQSYSIEVKRITVKRGKKEEWLKPKPLNFNEHFTFSTSKYERYQHQLHRQVHLSKQCGLVPVLVLKVVKPRLPADTYVFDSEELYLHMLAGEVSVNADEFPAFHRPELEKKIMNGGTLSATKRKESKKLLQSKRKNNKAHDRENVSVGQRTLFSDEDAV